MSSYAQSVAAHLEFTGAQSKSAYCMTDGLVTVSAMTQGMRPFWFCMLFMHNKHRRGDSQNVLQFNYAIQGLKINCE